MTEINYEVWKDKELARKFLTGVRGAIPFAHEQIEIMNRIINSCGINITNILDLGCGDGILAASILQFHPKASGVLLDISDAMLEFAREKLASYSNDLTFITADYGNKQWLDKVKDKAPFSVIVSGFSIHHQTDERKKELYSEIFGLLAYGGLFLNIEHVSSPTDWVNSLFNDCFIDSLYKMHRQTDINLTREYVANEYYRRDDKASNILTPLEIQCEWLRKIGFNDVDCYFKIFELTVFGGRKKK
jgi:tRNA (cmo5U34)-methyltransferase